jgi:hypothetical protein
MLSRLDPVGACLLRCSIVNAGFVQWVRMAHIAVQTGGFSQRTGPAELVLHGQAATICTVSRAV